MIRLRAFKSLNFELELAACCPTLFQSPLDISSYNTDRFSLRIQIVLLLPNINSRPLDLLASAVVSLFVGQSSFELFARCGSNFRPCLAPALDARFCMTNSM